MIYIIINIIIIQINYIFKLSNVLLRINYNNGEYNIVLEIVVYFAKLHKETYMTQASISTFCKKNHSNL